MFEAQRFESLGQLEAFYLSAPVVACTSLAINNALLTKRRFDYCIVDEASQISVPSCLGPLRLAKAFVLVGDHFQLPPLVRSKVAASEGLNKSLFSLLADAHPEAVAILRLQYRMNAEIMAISNRFVYQDMLVCGNERVARSRLVLPNLAGCRCKCMNSGCWLGKVLDPDRPVLFVNTDGVNAFESRSGSSYQNFGEAKLVHQVLDSIMAAGLSQTDVTVISPYRPQLKILKHDLRFPGVEMSTVDRFQGRDANCIIISLVRSNPEHQVGELLKDWNRLNVAFTRARSKLILVGSCQTVGSGEGGMRELVGMFEGNGWILGIGPGEHSFVK